MNYWAIREIEEREALLDKSILATENELAVQYKRTLKNIKGKMESLYDEILASRGDGTLLVSDLYKFNRYYELMNNLNAEMIKLGQKEIPIYEKHLINLYEQNSEIVGKHVGLTATINPDRAKQVVDTVWCNDGKRWSDRIWLHKGEMVSRLEKGLIDCVVSGASHEQLSEQIVKDFSTSFYNADRIARTELSHIQNQSALDKYKEAGITHYQFLATLDGKTCEEDRELNNKIFPISEAKTGINFPPLHPHCRCTILAVIGG